MDCFSKFIYFLQITIQGIQAETSMHPQDIALTFMLLGFIRKNMANKFLLALDWNKVEQHMQRVAKSLHQKTRINLDPDRLRWTPILTSPLHTSIYSGSPFKSHTIEPPETPETPKSGEKTTPDKGRARQNLNTALKSSGKKDGKKSTMSNRSASKKDGTKKGKNRVRARTRGASSTATTTTDDTSDDNEAEEDVSHVTPRKKRGKNNQDSINSDDEDQNNTQGTTTGKRAGNKRTSSRSKATTNESNAKKDENTKSSQSSKGKKNTMTTNDTNKRGGKQRARKMSNQSGECLGMDGGTNININTNKKQKNFKKKHGQHIINYHFQDNGASKRRKMFLNNDTHDDDSDEDDFDHEHNENDFEFESSTTGIRTQSRYSPTGDSTAKSLFNRGCIGDLLYHKKPNSNMKKSTSPKVM